MWLCYFDELQVFQYKLVLKIFNKLKGWKVTSSMFILTAMKPKQKEAGACLFIGNVVFILGKTGITNTIGIR